VARRIGRLVCALILLLAAIGGAQSRPARAILQPHLGYGINVRSPDRLDMVAELGFDWVKLWDEYGWWPAERLPYQVLYLLSCADYVEDPSGWEQAVAQAADAGRGLVEAYEICNEPNSTHFWDGRPPDPARFTQMLCAAYTRIKAVDPRAVVVSGGLAPVGRIQGDCNGWSGNNCGAMDEREYARAMLQQGAGACMDAFGYHPYGFAYEPERDPASVDNGFAFRGAEVMREILLEYDLDDVPVWATEFSWLRDPAEDGPYPEWCHRLEEYEDPFGWMDVSEEDQADYLARAFQYADDNWEWMRGMFVWNLDWHNYNWLCEPSRYFSVRRDDGSAEGAPTLAYDALAGLEKRPAPTLLVPWLTVQPPWLAVMADVDQGGVFTTSLQVDNAGWGSLSWVAAVDPAGAVTVTLPITAGVQGEPVWVRVETTGLLTGTYAAAITVTATATDVMDSPARVPVTVYVVAELRRAFLPLVLRGR
jgi:hypothetical protein